MGKVAVVGSTGYIAQYIVSELNEKIDKSNIILIDRSRREGTYYLELTKAEDFNYDILNEVEFLVFMAAVSGPDECANEFEACWKINVEGTQYFTSEAVKRKCKVLFFSSDAVFGDIPGMIYLEDTETNALTAYGRMKKTIEDSFKDNPYFKVIRLPYVISLKDRFTSYCLNCIRSKVTAQIYHPFYRNCITVSDVVSSVIWLRDNWDKYPYWALNLAGLELVSRVRIADEINRIINNQLVYEIIIPDAKFFENRPRISQMNSIYLDKFQIIQRESFTKKIQRMMEEYNE